MPKLLLACTVATMAMAANAAAQPILRVPDLARLPEGLSEIRAIDGLSWVSCEVGEIAAFEDRSHVRCANGQGEGTASQPPDYIAVDIRANAGLAASLVTAGTRARTGRTPLYALIHNNPRNNPPGCDAGNCRGTMGCVVE